MSSRLLSMKFMQRATASANTSPNTTPDGREAKRQRLSTGSFKSSPSSKSQIDRKAVQAALDEEERRRQEAVDREAARRGETKWYLDVQQSSTPATKPLIVVSTGYASLDTQEHPHDLAESDDDDDAEDEDEDEDVRPIPVTQGRQRFGNFKSKAEADKKQDAAAQDESEDEDDETSPQQKPNGRGQSAGNTPQSQSAKRKADRLSGARDSPSDTFKRLHLDKVTSISSGGGQGRPQAHLTCFNCGGKGHIKSRCPKASR